MAKELLLEIGTEEIPARFLPPVLEEMAVSFRKMLDAERIGVGEILTWGTPRRLALVAREVADDPGRGHPGNHRSSQGRGRGRRGPTHAGGRRVRPGPGRGGLGPH